MACPRLMFNAHRLFVAACGQDVVRGVSVDRAVAMDRFVRLRAITRAHRSANQNNGWTSFGHS